MDIEGSELQAIPEWISSGILEDIDQIGFEIHINGIEGEELRKEMIRILDNIRKLHQLGFRLIYSENNDCVGKDYDVDQHYLNLIELVFYKQK